MTENLAPNLILNTQIEFKSVHSFRSPNFSIGPQALAAEYKDVGCLSNCQAILEHSSSPYAQLMAASSMYGLVTNKYTALDLQQRLHMSML
jgi:hypothetical protein